MNLALEIEIARAKVAVKKRKRKKATEERKALTSAMVLEAVENAVAALPKPVNGTDGRDAPSMEEILEQIKPLIPEPEIVEPIIKQERYVDEDAMADFWDKKLPEMEKQFRPKVELIREEIDESRLEGFVSKKELDEALKRVQDAITYHSGGGGVAQDLVNLIQVSSDTTITAGQLLSTKINIVLAMTPNITITLPAPTAEKIIITQQGYSGDETYTVIREA